MLTIPIKNKTLVVIPSEPLEEYEAKGLIGLREYYNPQNMFDKVYLFSPREKNTREAYGMSVVPTGYYQLADKIKKTGVSVVRAYGGFWAADMACRNRVPGVPIIVSVHDPSPELIHQSVCYADYVFCVSEIVAQAAIKKGVEKERIRILPCLLYTSPSPRDS